uniref:Carbonic anhydrase 7-like n=1 Tax=Gouania willdenowi TaxID=441366 RepID=A0A8C5HIZ3_GOUWI
LFCIWDPSHWAALFPSCGGLRQSPINIVSSKVHVNSALPPFDFIGHTNTLNITVENKGHSAHFHLPQSVRLTGGALPGHYRASQFHFHWGGNGNPGSEHTIDGERFPMEVENTTRPSLASLGDVIGAPRDLKFRQFYFIFLATLLTLLYYTTVIPNFRLSDVIPSSRELHNYYRYVGSITTPGCEQAVTWTLFHKTLAISSRQVRKPEFLKKRISKPWRTDGYTSTDLLVKQ